MNSTTTTRHMYAPWRHLGPISRLIVCAMIALFGCAGSQHATPAPVVSVVGFSSLKDPGLARSAAEHRAITRAAYVAAPAALGFRLTRGGGRTTLKLTSAETSVGVATRYEPRRPSGGRAVAEVRRDDAGELAALARLSIVSVSAAASGLDAALAHERAERAAIREAILRAAALGGRREPVLAGTLTFVNYRVGEGADTITVSADIHVDWNTQSGGDTQATEATPPISEDQEEIVPPEEQDLSSDAASAPLKQKGPPR